MRPGPVIVAVAIAAVLVACVLVLNNTREDFTTYNADWNGASQAKNLLAGEGYSTRTVFALSEVGDLGGGVLFMLNPSAAVPFTSDDSQYVQSFVQDGGSLILANDFGNGNAVLSGLGVADSVRFNGSLLSDNVSRGVDAAHPIVTKITPSGLTSGVHLLYFNYGTTLDAAGNVPVLASSAPTSYLRASAAGTAGINGSTGEKPVLASLAYGKGRIILVSDPSLFINEMINKADNGQLLTSLVANLTSGNTAVPIIFDESLRASPPLSSLVYDRINSDDNIKYSIILLSTAAFAGGTYARALKRRRDNPEEVREVIIKEETAIADIMRAHPQWHRSRIRGFLRQLQKRRRTTNGNRKSR